MTQEYGDGCRGIYIGLKFSVLLWVIILIVVMIILHLSVSLSIGVAKWNKMFRPI
jgi:hypothetical protein